MPVFRFLRGFINKIALVSLDPLIRLTFGIVLTPCAQLANKITRVQKLAAFRAHLVSREERSRDIALAGYDHTSSSFCI
jgi:sulfopyruvate decarboxylase TPP-binding subunit